MMNFFPAYSEARGQIMSSTYDVCAQPPRKGCKIGGHKSLLAAHRSNGKKFLRQRTKSGRATKLHFQQAGYVWAGGSNRWVKKKRKSTKKNPATKVSSTALEPARRRQHQPNAELTSDYLPADWDKRSPDHKKKKASTKKKVECDKSTRTGRLNNCNGKC